MAEFNPRNRNRHHDGGALSWSERFYDNRALKKPPSPCGFHVPEKANG